MTVQQIHKSQKEFYNTRQTVDVNFRISSLQRLQEELDGREQEIYQALEKDLGKSKFESYLTEYQVVQKELKKYIKNLKKWSRPQSVRPSLLNFPSKARRYPEPYGNTLIISPWNYPFQLAMAPLIGAVAAGNTVVLKPSEFSTATSQLLGELIAAAFASEHATVVQGDGEIAQELTSLAWNYLFFTGSPAIGKKIYQAAAQHLTPVTLELGGKNPGVVHSSANIDVSAKRIVWAKFLNAGQTCIAPDYLLVHHTVKASLVASLQKHLRSFYSDNPKSSPDYPRIIRKQHLQRLTELLNGQEIIHGGEYDTSNLYMAPTLVNQPDHDTDLMQEEIFGPILPIIAYTSRKELEKWIESYEQPLGAYVFSTDSKFDQWFVNRFSFGGGAVNDSIVQFINDRLPFGGVGNSGIGSYHGKKTFETFTHYKSVVHRGTWLDIPIKYPPYAGKFNWVKRVLGWL